jgi:hypothetical protein
VGVSVLTGRRDTRCGNGAVSWEASVVDSRQSTVFSRQSQSSVGSLSRRSAVSVVGRQSHSLVGSQRASQVLIVSASSDDAAKIVTWFGESGE